MWRRRDAWKAWEAETSGPQAGTDGGCLKKVVGEKWEARRERREASVRQPKTSYGRASTPPTGDGSDRPWGCRGHVVGLWKQAETTARSRRRGPRDGCTFHVFPRIELVSPRHLTSMGATGRFTPLPTISAALHISRRGWQCCFALRFLPALIRPDMALERHQLCTMVVSPQREHFSTPGPSAIAP